MAVTPPPSSAFSASGADALSASSAESLRSGSFDTAAAQYADSRPSYPSVLLDALEECSGRPLAGAQIVDVGAGTGIATALLRGRGAHVLAVEPGERMAAELRRRVPGVPVVRGNGNALPIAGASVDFVTYAQAWHWTDPARAVPEAWRVLRSGGALAMWWNEDALDVPWIAAQKDRVARHFGSAPSPRPRDEAGRLRAAFKGLKSTPPYAHRQLRWSRTVSVDKHLTNIGSHSIFLVNGDHARTFLTEERARLLSLFPEGQVEEVYDVLLIVALRP
ncbi:class I SAM-dependent methyltransferase [Streptomyces sp. NPDC090442]|uniref:class I SAM-dependent methyltransferase n=1 Tax=Streptomyces sp. NPDC090442 TaxID=3365962 RepID=UPI00380C3B00